MFRSNVRKRLKMNVESKISHHNYSDIATAKARHKSGLFENFDQTRDNTPSKQNIKINFKVFDSTVITKDVRFPNINQQKD